MRGNRSKPNVQFVSPKPKTKIAEKPPSFRNGLVGPLCDPESTVKPRQFFPTLAGEFQGSIWVPDCPKKAHKTHSRGLKQAKRAVLSRLFSTTTRSMANRFTNSRVRLAVSCGGGNRRGYDPQLVVVTFCYQG
jgi:hypothetical protein